jgi:hypothetical protein
VHRCGLVCELQLLDLAESGQVLSVGDAAVHAGSVSVLFVFLGTLQAVTGPAVHAGFEAGVLILPACGLAAASSGLAITRLALPTRAELGDCTG